MAEDPRADRELLAAWAAGDTGAADALLARHFDAVFRFLRTKLDRGLEDVVQATFLACLEARHRFQADSTFRTFLLGIARHQLFRIYRERHRDAKARDPGSVPAAELSGTPSRIVADREEQRILLEGLRAIPLDLQIALELHYWDELPVDSMAQILEIPPGTVKSRLHRGRCLLRERIEAFGSSDAVLRSTTADLDGWARSLRALLERR